MARLARDHDDLPAVMAFMRHEIREHVADIEGQVAPDVSFRRWDLPARGKTQLEQCFHSLAAPFQRRHELPPCDATMIDARRGRDAVFAAERFEPPAAGVVEVGGDRADRAVRSRHRDVP